MFVFVVAEDKSPVVSNRLILVSQFEPRPSEPKEGVTHLTKGGRLMDDFVENLLSLEELSLEITGPSQEVVNPVGIGTMGIECDILLESILRKAVQFVVEGADGNG